MKNRVLFVISRLATGGTNSSLDSLYTNLKERYEISVFAMSHIPRIHNYSFDEVLLPQDFKLSLIFSSYAEQKGLQKIIALWYKIIRSCYSLFGKEYLYIYGKRVAKRLENSTAYDFIIAFEEGPATTFVTLFKNPNKISWIHCNYDKYLPQGKTEEAIYNAYKRVVCVSQYTASVFANRYPALAERTVAIHNLIDSEKIRRMAGERIKDERFIANGMTLISVGRISPVKRFREIPSIAANLKKQGIEFNWYIIGPGEGSEAESLRKNIINNAVEDCVKWLGGKSNPYPFIKAADIYVCTSESEACPMVFKEAQVLGIPIVTTDFPSSYEFVRDGEGIITNFENISDSISVMIRNVQNRHDIVCSDDVCSDDDDNERNIKHLITIFDS